MHGRLRKIISLVLSFGLLFQQIGFAQIATELNIASHLSRMASNLTVEKFRPPHLRYFSYDSLTDNFKVLLDKGDFDKGILPEATAGDTLRSRVSPRITQGTISEEALKQETQTLLSYFLIGLTLPDSTFWVNLRPDSEDQIIDSYLEKTDVGKIMLEADLQLKKDTALFTSPQTPEGKEYWNKLYKKAAELYGYDNVTIPTLTRPWIVPGEIIVRESKDSAYVYKAGLKVMLEQDYLKDSAAYNFSRGAGSRLLTDSLAGKDERLKQLNDYSSQLIRELIIPKLTREVNSSKRYASLRQVYYSLILSRWFKLRFKGLSPSKKGLSPSFDSAQDSLRSQGTVPSFSALIDSKELTNLISKDTWSKTDYFKQYQKSFSEGEYNVKEPVYTPTGQVIRSYFSGGIDVASSAINTQNGILGKEMSFNNLSRLGVLMEGNSITGIKVSAASPIIQKNNSVIPKELFLMTYKETGSNIAETAKILKISEIIAEHYKRQYVPSQFKSVDLPENLAKGSEGAGSPVKASNNSAIFGPGEISFESIDIHRKIERRALSGPYIDLNEIFLDGKVAVISSATGIINKVLSENRVRYPRSSSADEERILNEIAKGNYAIGDFGKEEPLNMLAEVAAQKLAALMVEARKLNKEFSVVLYSDNPGVIDLSGVLKAKGYIVKTRGQEDVTVNSFTLLVNFATILDNAGKLLDCESKFKQLIKDKSNVAMMVLPDNSKDTAMLTAIRVFSRSRALYDAASSAVEADVMSLRDVLSVLEGDSTLWGSKEYDQTFEKDKKRWIRYSSGWIIRLEPTNIEKTSIVVKLVRPDGLIVAQKDDMGDFVLKNTYREDQIFDLLAMAVRDKLSMAKYQEYIDEVLPRASSAVTYIDINEVRPLDNSFTFQPTSKVGIFINNRFLWFTLQLARYEPGKKTYLIFRIDNQPVNYAYLGNNLTIGQHDVVRTIMSRIENGMRLWTEIDLTEALKKELSMSQYKPLTPLVQELPSLITIESIKDNKIRVESGGSEIASSAVENPELVKSYLFTDDELRDSLEALQRLINEDIDDSGLNIPHKRLIFYRSSNWQIYMEYDPFNFRKTSVTLMDSQRKDRLYVAYNGIEALAYGRAKIEEDLIKVIKREIELRDPPSRSKASSAVLKGETATGPIERRMAELEQNLAENWKLINRINEETGININEINRVGDQEELTVEKQRNVEAILRIRDRIHEMTGELSRLNTQKELGASSAVGEDIDASLRSASMSNKGVGGIDFRALSMTIQPMGSFAGLNFKLPQLSQQELGRIDIPLEVERVKNMVESGTSPSGSRIKELIAACKYKQQEAYINDLFICLLEGFKVEQENALESSPDSREALVVADMLVSG